MLNTNLYGRHAVVCGSTQGIGWAAARNIATLGARVTLVARNAATLAERAAELPGDGHAFVAADFDQPQKLGELMRAHLQENPAQILINNTGGPPGGRASDADIDAYRIAFNRHLVCNQLLAQAVLPGMQDARFGRIINVISTSVREPIPNLGVSNTVRGAVASWAKTLASELGPDGITVNNVLPGFTATARLEQIINDRCAKTGASREDVEQAMQAQVPLRRFADADELGQVIAFLASPAAGYISGVSLAVDGGRTRSI